MKFLTPDLVSALRENVKKDPWAAEVSHSIIEAAEYWKSMSDDDLWGLMYGPTITRSWDVWSTGHCPLCRRDVPLYNWEIDGQKLSWKVRCPHCREIFPTNDFEKFYRSGLDEHNIFQYALADRSLLFNEEHPDPADPEHLFGVDDGEGYVDGEKRWRFIGAYLIYAQWKQLVLGGISSLSVSHVLTGDPVYAHKAAVLLDRVADLYPGFDHMTQAWVEEVFRTEGYVSTWHDACEETREMALAYDYIRDAIESDEALAKFLNAKAKDYRIGASKATPADVCRNIENGILRDPLKNLNRIHSNYPRREICVMVIHGVLAEPENKAEMQRILDDVLETATRVDGLTGEKGLAAYSAYVIQSLAVFLAQLERVEPGAIAELMQRHPNLKQTYRFHIDTWCGQEYYPRIGDTGHFAGKDGGYCGVVFTRGGRPGYHAVGALMPSMLGFMWKLYELTGDHAYVQVLHHANGGTLEGLPHDLCEKDAAGFQKKVESVIARRGTELELGNVLKPDWRLGILRSGRGASERSAWLCYDTGGRHSHANGLTMGLFAKGLDLMPDYGYPPLQISGAGGPHVHWYIITHSHNTVVVDQTSQVRPQVPVGGRCTLWADGKSVAAVRASAVEVMLGAMVSERMEMSGPAHQMVGLYFHEPARCTKVRVFTKEEPPWMVVFEDSFSRAEIGPDWRVLHGKFRIENGALVGQGTLLCTRKFPGNQRIEFEASTQAETPCDLSAVLLSNEQGVDHGVFFGFGSNNNIGSKIVLQKRDACRSDSKITPGKSYKIMAESDGEVLRHVVDGVEIQRYVNSAEGARKAVQIAGRQRQFERTIVRMDISEEDSYFLDIFRVVGGRDHAKFMGSHFASITVEGLSLSPAENYSEEALMRNFMTDRAAQPGWSADWRVHDRYKYLPPGKEVHLRYTDLTTGAEASTCEGWVVEGPYSRTDQTWIPRLMVRRRAETMPLASTFMAVIEPYEAASRIAGIRRRSLHTTDGTPFGDAHVAVEVTLADGRSDLIMAADVENVLGAKPAFTPTAPLVQRDWNVSVSAELCIVRRNAAGRTEQMQVFNGC